MNLLAFLPVHLWHRDSGLEPCRLLGRFGIGQPRRWPCRGYLASFSVGGFSWEYLLGLGTYEAWNHQVQCSKFTLKVKDLVDKQERLLLKRSGIIGLSHTTLRIRTARNIGRNWLIQPDS
jgi:hypothetical protein